MSSSSGPALDYEGDTPMGGINAIVAAVIQALNTNKSGNDRKSKRGKSLPNAKWKSSETVRRCREQGLCIRCEKAGHKFWDCPTYSGAKPPNTQVLATGTTPVASRVTEVESDEGEGEESGNEESPSIDALGEGRETSRMRAKRMRKMRSMDTTPFIIDVLMNSAFYVDALFDSGCLCLSAFSSQFVHNRKLPRIPIEARPLRLADKDEREKMITHITYADIDINGRCQRIFGYIIKDLSYDLILGKPWMEKNGVVYRSAKRTIEFEDGCGGVVHEKGWYQNGAPKEVKTKVSPYHATAAAMMMIGSHFAALERRARRDKSIWVSST